MRSHLIFKITIVSVSPKINSNGVCRKHFRWSIRSAFNAKVINTTIDEIMPLTVNIF